MSPLTEQLRIIEQQVNLVGRGFWRPSQTDTETMGQCPACVDFKNIDEPLRFSSQMRWLMLRSEPGRCSHVGLRKLTQCCSVS
jgi:hypothetical protein